MTPFNIIVEGVMVAMAKTGDEWDEDVKLGEIDVRPAAAVRAELNREAVEDYAAADLAGVEFTGPMPTVYLYKSNRWVHLLADGRHRLEARKANSRETIRCRVIRCRSKEEAERRAYAHAAGANESHGLRRTTEDKHAAIAAVIGRPEYEEASDRAIGDLCGKLKHGTVRLVRERLSREGKLTGKAHADARGYLPDAVIGGGRRADGNGGTVSAPGRSASAGRAASPDPDEGQPEEDRTVDPVPAVIPPAAATDELGRPLPTALWVVFGSRFLFRAFGKRVGALVREVEELAGDPAGAALTMNPIRVDGENLSKGVAGAMPYCVCPDYGDAGCGAGCKHCSGRGWLSRLRFLQLPGKLQAFARSFAPNNAGVSQAIE